MEMEPRLQRRATGSIMLKFVPLSKRLIVIRRIIRAYFFESKYGMDIITRRRTSAAKRSPMYANADNHIYIFEYEVRMNLCQFEVSVSLTRVRKN